MLSLRDFGDLAAVPRILVKEEMRRRPGQKSSQQ